jgi:diadenosine tetraphosphate (Ap4A) HIT family hydrolase
MRAKSVDWVSIRKSLDGRCFVCEVVAGNPEFAHHVIYEDARFIAFLNRYPTLYGSVLVAPREHREQVTGDFSVDGYQAMQAVVFRVAEAVRGTVPTERMYILSLGSQQGNRHVHWHIAPLPPGMPFEDQQLRALDGSEILDLSDHEQAELARQLREAMAEAR